MSNASESRKVVAAANVLGGKTARACDSCLLKRARWFCAADDAFLCQGCDTAVHSANQLAGRHHRVRLRTASLKGNREELGCSSSWHQGFTKKARTRRRPAKSVLLAAAVVSDSMDPVVPEMNAEENYFFSEMEKEEEQLFPTVPDSEVDPFVNEFMEEGIGQELNIAELLNSCDEFGDLLGSEEVKLFDGQDRVKVEDDENDNKYELLHEAVVMEGHHFDDDKLEMEEINWEFDDYACSIVGEDGDEAEAETKMGLDALHENTRSLNTDSDQSLRSQLVKETMLLRLNYEQVMDAWASQGCPWENGVRPVFDLDSFMAELRGGDNCGGGGMMNRRDHQQVEREARVLRYREKRRTRLFSKKIRYEVRKLNAEKRPRMKGRFVKRPNFSGASSLPSSYIIN